MTQANTAKTTKPAALTSKPGQKKPQAKGNRPQGQRRQFAPAQTLMESKLATLFNLSTQRANGQLADIKTIGEEGEGHINVHRNSKSKLGFLLSTAASHEFTLFNKRFTSIDNLTMYYRSHCTVDALATGSVGLNREFNRNRVKLYPLLKNMFVVVCLAYVEIFKRTPVLLEAMADNKLPLDSYDIDNGTKQRKRHQASSTLVAVIQEAFQAVRDNREPDLKKFMFQDMGRALAVRAATSGKSFLEVVNGEFSPRAIRESFNSKHADLAQQLREEEQRRREETKAARQARNAKAAEPVKAAAEAEAPVAAEAPVELGDTNEIIKGEVGLEVIKDAPAAEAVAQEAEVVKTDAPAEEAVAVAVAPVTE